jgi:hypothetical protein
MVHSWEGLGAGRSHSVRSLALYNGQIFAGGSFDNSGSTQVNSIAQWDGNAWQPLGSGLRFHASSGYAYAMTVYDNKLIVGGWFDSAGEIPAHNIAAWDGSNWSALGSGTDSISGRFSFWDGPVFALKVFHDKLMVGGDFMLAGGKVSSCIAMWTKVTPTDVPDEDDNHVMPGHFDVAQNYPNPFNPATTIAFSLPKRSRVTIEVFNMLGQRVRTLLNDIKSAGTHTILWDGRDDCGQMQATGTYFYRTLTDGIVTTKKMLLLK